jgi:hypothetical protein
VTYAFPHFLPPQVDPCEIVFHVDGTMDTRRYNAPTTNEVAGFMPGGENDQVIPRQMQAHRRLRGRGPGRPPMQPGSPSTSLAAADATAPRRGRGRGRPPGPGPRGPRGRGRPPGPGPRGPRGRGRPPGAGRGRGRPPGQPASAAEGHNSADVVFPAEESDTEVVIIPSTHPWYDALHFVLLHPRGEAGWSKTDGAHGSSLTARDYYAFFMHDREDSNSLFVRAGRLFQEWIIAGWSRVESNKLQYYRSHQEGLRASTYSN